MKKVLIIAFEFPPLGSGGVLRLTKYVKYLREFGWEPVVLTIDENANIGGAKDYSLLRELPQDLEIHRTAYVDFDVLFKKEVQDSALLKLYHALDLNFTGIFSITKPDKNITWFPAALEKAQQLAIKGDIELVFTDSPPNSTSLIGHKLKRDYGIPWVADFRDPWSLDDLAYEALGIRYHKRARDLDLLFEQISLEPCDKIIVVSNKLKDRYVEQLDFDPNKLEVFSDGYDEEDFSALPNSANIKDNRFFEIMYMGSFYGSYNPTAFLKSLHSLIEKHKMEDISFHVIGHGSNWVEQNIEQLGLDSIRRFIHLESHMESRECLSKMCDADLLLAISPPHIDYNVPQKIYSYMRIGAPIFAVMPENGEAAMRIRENKSGFVVDPARLDQIEDKLLELYSLWKNDKLEHVPDMNRIQQFEKRALTGKLCEIFNALYDGRSRRIEAMNTRGENLFQDGKGEEALKAFQEAMVLNPFNPETLNNIGVVLFSFKAPKEALHFLNRAIAVKPWYKDAFVNAIQANLMLGKKEEAQRTLLKAKGLFPLENFEPIGVSDSNY